MEPQAAADMRRAASLLVHLVMQQFEAGLKAEAAAANSRSDGLYSSAADHQSRSDVRYPF
jgi:hypothetical protein